MSDESQIVRDPKRTYVANADFIVGDTQEAIQKGDKRPGNDPVVYDRPKLWTPLEETPEYQAQVAVQAAAIRAAMAPEPSEGDSTLGEEAVPDGAIAAGVNTESLVQGKPEYLPLSEIETVRMKLAKEGRAHGYDSLGGKHGIFPGMRSTIVRRYKGHPAPGTAIPGVCDEAPPHQHKLSTPEPPT